MHVLALSDLACLRRRLPRSALVAAALCCAMLSSAGPLRAAPFLEFVDPNPAAGNQFGASVVALSTGNVVIASPSDDAGGVDAGAVYLFNGSTGALISTMRGSTANDLVGSGGVTALSNGNYVVLSPSWDNGAIVNAGAATWGSGTSGVNGVVSAANSLVGSTTGDFVGGFVRALSNGNYVVQGRDWDNGAVADAGAATWGSGTAGVTGTISAANSLVGSTAGDFVGTGVTALSNGNYVVLSPNWDSGATVDAGAVSWGSGTTGVTGAVSAANSLVGSTAFDQVGGSGATALSNGHYVVRSQTWDNGAIADAGAVTWGSGTAGVTGAVSAANSLVGSTAGDAVGTGVTALSNGNYVALNPSWDNGAVVDAGAATWGSGTVGVSGAVAAANSLVGSTAGDNVASAGVTALSNGHYVVASPSWDNGATVNAGAATWGSGTVGVTGAVAAANSLVGSTASDFVGGFVTALSNGNYVVLSSNWDDGAVSDAGAATWGSGTAGITGAVSAVNSLVGSSAGDKVSGSGVTALSNGNYVVRSVNWDNGAQANAGAVTWGSGTAGVTGAVSPANSLVGSQAGSQVGSGSVTALSNGNYVVGSPLVNSLFADVGAATWGSGTTGVTGGLSGANSLIGSAAGDRVGSSVTALSNGNYVVLSPSWDNGAIANAGAATWGNGLTGVTGVVSVANSLVGSTASDQVGSGGVTALSNGHYAVTSSAWDNGALINAGAASWGGGTIGVSGAISAANSLIGASANTSLLLPIDDSVNKSFFARFSAEGGGRVRVGPPGSPEIVSAVDMPNDQGGWLRLTFNRSIRDDGNAAPPVAMYGVWRLVPGSVAFSAGMAYPDAAVGSRPDLLATEKLRALLSTTLDAREVEGRCYVTGSPAPGIAFTFPVGTWELVTSVPAVQRTQYVVAVPTISNLEANDYVVTAHTTTPSIWFRSNTANGQSVDNMALAGSGVGELAFALEGVHPNPASGSGLYVAFALPTPAPARLELLDVSGRRVLTRKVNSLGRGRHRVNLAEGRRVAPGVYWVRLTQGTNRQATRLAVID
jgi:uncharacterized protein DUF5650